MRWRTQGERERGSMVQRRPRKPRSRAQRRQWGSRGCGSWWASMLRGRSWRGQGASNAADHVRARKIIDQSVGNLLMAELNLNKLVDEIFLFQNQVRADPKSVVPRLMDRLKYFNNLILQVPYNAPVKTREGRAVVEEAISVLQQQPPLEPLEWSYDLHLAADEHSIDAGQNGLIGHISSKGVSMKERVLKYCAYRGHLTENIEIGSKTAEEIVLSLLIDDGLSTRFHRKNILSDKLRYVGIGVNPHVNYQFITVITYAESLKDEPQAMALEAHQDASFCNSCQLY